MFTSRGPRGGGIIWPAPLKWVFWAFTTPSADCQESALPDGLPFGQAVLCYRKVLIEAVSRDGILSNHDFNAKNPSEAPVLRRPISIAPFAATADRKDRERRSHEP
jgi:hypothetical protein